MQVRVSIKWPYTRFACPKDSLFFFFKTRFRFDLKSKATLLNSPTHSSTGTQSEIINYFFFLLLISLPFHVLFHFFHPCFSGHPFQVFFSSFPHGTIRYRSLKSIQALRGGPRWFTRDFTCIVLLGKFINARIFSSLLKLLDYHHLWYEFSFISFQKALLLLIFMVLFIGT